MSGYRLREPAKNWCEGGLCGNGRLGAIVMGIPSQEQIILNQEELFAPLYGAEKPIPMAAHLPEIRQLLKEKKYKEAGAIPWNIFCEKYPEKLWTNPFVPAGRLLIETVGVETYGQYSRSLDFTTGVAEVTFVSNGICYGRKVAASREYQKIFVELTAEDTEAVYRVTVEKQPDLKDNMDFPYAGLYDFMEGKTLAEDYELQYLCRYKTEGGYCVHLRIPKSEHLACRRDGNYIEIKSSGKVILEIGIELLDVEKRDLGQAAIPDYEMVFGEKKHGHSERMNRISLKLKEDRAYPSDKALYEAVQKTHKADPAFLNKIFEAGRYAILSSSGKLPPNLQGVWNASYQVPWSSDYTQDGNLQTAILGMMPCGDFEGIRSFFDYQEALMGDYRENSEILYNCRGIHVPTRTSDRGYDIHFDEIWPMLFWTAGAGWNAKFFYDYWLYTGDDRFFMEHALPYMKEAALFYEDYLVEDENGKWMFTPSYSPENTAAGHDASGSVNATMDISVAKELLTNLISGCRTLHLTEEEENVRKWEEMLGKMPPYLINEDGALQEWSAADYTDEYDHRHISHLYLLFYDIPGEVRKDKELYAACRKAYEIKMERKKKEQGTMAFGLIQAGMVAAHLNDPEMVEILLQSMVCNDYYPTFASSHDYGPNLFNVDISGGLPALMLESIAQSFPILKENLEIDHFEIKLLPALPKSMHTGEIKGLRLRGGFMLDMKWADGKVSVYTLHNMNGNPYTIV